jgi:hypothetical protein
MGEKKGIAQIVRDLELEEDTGLRESDYEVKSPRDTTYNCIAFAVGDLTQFWDDLDSPAGMRVKGYYWPPGVPGTKTLAGWIKVFELHGYTETDDSSLDPEYEKIAIYVGSEGPEHVARQKASGAWVSKMGKGVDIEHFSLECLEGDFYGKVVKIMRRKCQGGRVLE